MSSCNAAKRSNFGDESAAGNANGTARKKLKLMDCFPGTGTCCEWTGIDWHAFLRRLSTHPEEAAECDLRGYHLLHKVVAADYPPAPLDVVKCVFNAYPEAIRRRTFIGSTVLELATCNCHVSEAVFRFILQKYPEATSVTCDLGYIPLHYVADAWKARILINAFPRGLEVSDNLFGCTPLMSATKETFTPPEVIETLIEEGWRHGVGGRQGGGGVFHGDKYGLTPLGWIVRYAERIFDDSDHHCRGNGEAKKCNDEKSCDKPKISQAEGRIVWEKLACIVRAAYASYARRDVLHPQEPLLCCMIGVGCHSPAFISRILSDRPDEVSARDRSGRTPLHIAASMAGTEPFVFDMLLNSECGRATARMADASGRLPLHLAAESGLCFNQGGRSIIKAEGRAAGTIDRLTGTYPFMLAAVGHERCIDMVYTLIREVPEKLKHHAWSEDDLER